MESKPQYGISPLMAIRDCVERQRLCREFIANQMRNERVVKSRDDDSFDFEPIELSEIDIKMIEYIKFDTEQIAKAYNMPIELLNTGECGKTQAAEENKRAFDRLKRNLY